MGTLEGVPVVYVSPFLNVCLVPIYFQKLAYWGGAPCTLRGPPGHIPGPEWHGACEYLQIYCTTLPVAGPKYVEVVWPPEWTSLYLSKI